MRSGLEHVSDKAIETFVTNLKSGVLEVVDMGPKALVGNPDKKECPPCAAFETNLGMLQAFQAECLRRGLDYDTIGPDIREIEDMWLQARE